MSDLPTDLVPLPTAPYDERPLSLALDVEECRTALHLSEGNVTGAAKLLKIGPARLRAFIRGNAYLQREQEEARAQIADMAEEVVKEELKDPDKRGSMARWVLDRLGRDRGYGTQAQGGSGKVTFGDMVIEWGNGDVIEGSVENAE